MIEWKQPTLKKFTPTKRFLNRIVKQAKAKEQEIVEIPLNGLINIAKDYDELLFMARMYARELDEWEVAKGGDPE